MNTRRAAIKFALVAAAATAFGPATAASKLNKCTLNGKPLYGKVQVVKSFPDFRVQRVQSFPDLKVEVVKSFPDKCGKWMWVNSFPDFTIEYVEAFPDFTIEFVESFPGEP
jgi:hypothetical protein